MVELPGYVKGKTKLFKDSIPSDADYYVARIAIDSIGTKRHFPLLSYFENGRRNFSSELVGRTMIVGKQWLEDMVEFQNATYTVIEGLYWNEGFNDQSLKPSVKCLTHVLNTKQKVIRYQTNDE